MSMTRKDFQVIADALRDSRPERQSDFDGNSYRNSQWNEDVDAVTYALQHNYHNFDTEKFIQAVLKRR